jgi:hypothetical protein
MVVVSLSIAFFVASGATSCAPDKPDTKGNTQLSSAAGGKGGGAAARSTRAIRTTPPRDSVRSPI